MAMEQGKSCVVDSNASLAGEELYRQFFEEAIEGICLADPETGIIYDCNQAFSCLTGYDRSELIGQSHTIYHRKEDIRPPFSSTFALHRSGKKGAVLNDLIVTKSGKLKEVEIKASVIELGGRQLMHAFFRDLTDELRGRRERETSLELMRLLNDRNHTHELIRNLTECLQKWSGCDAVGIRLRVGEDFPYYESRGFSGEFVEAENSLCQRDLDGQIVCDNLGNPVLECMCGNILCGRFDPTLPFFTANGSFWTNCTTDLLATTTEAQRQARTRNRCSGEGYESVALIPLRFGDRIMGLLQLNNRASGQFTPELISFLENISCQIAITLAQREMQASLEASEERYRRLLEVEPDAIFLVDIETERIVDANTAAISLYGYTHDEFLLLKASDISAEPEKTRQAILSGWKHTPLCWHRKKDGTVFPVEFAGSNFNYQGRQIQMAAIHDITKRKQAEEAIQESQRQNEFLAKIIEYSSQPFIVGYADGRLGLFNTAFQKLLGYSEEELKTINWLNTITPPEWREFSLNKLEELRHNGPSIRYEKEYFRKDGTRIPIETLVHVVKDATGEVLYYYAFTVDITERKQAEEALREKDRKLQLFMENSGDVIWAMNFTGQCNYTSPSVEQLLGYTPEEFNQLSYDYYLSPSSAAIAINHINEALAELALGKPIQPQILELEHRRKDGTYFWAEASCNGMYDEAGVLIGFQGITRDITERKRIEESLRESEERYRGLFENMTESYAYHRMIFENGEPRDYVFLAVNEAFETMTGLRDVIGKKVSEIMPGFRESNPELLAIYSRVSTTGISEKLESYVESLNAWYSISVYSSEKEYFTTVFDNITARKKAEIALRKSEELFSKAFHGSPMAMVITSLVDHRIIDVNVAFEETTGYSRDELVGRDFRVFGFWVETQGMEQAMQTIAKEGKYRCMEFEFRTRSGEHRIGQLSAETVEIAGKQCTLTVAEDITERRRTAKALDDIAREKTELLEKMNEAQHLATIGSWEWDLHTNRVWWSDETYRIFGVTPQDFAPSFEANGGFIHPDDSAIYGESFAHSLQTGEPLDIDLRIISADGHLKYCHARGKIVSDDAGQPIRFVGTIMDISEKKRSEDALRVNEERFHLTFEHIRSGMGVYEVDEGGEDFIIKEFNPAAERICRVKRDEVLGRRLSQVFPSVKGIGLFAMFQRVWRSGNPECLPAIFYEDDHISFWVENDVIKLPTGEIVSIFEDITDRKLAETELQKSETWHRSLIELGVSVYMVLDEKRQIHYASPLVESVFGWKPTEVFRKPIFEFLASDDAELASRFFAEILHAPKCIKRLHAHIRCKDGESKVMEIFGINLLDEPAVKGIVLSSHDITEQVHAQERLEAFREELAHASRMASLGAMAAGIAHEINQPLSIMTTWTEIAMREIRDNLTGDKREAFLSLQRIDSALERSGTIIRNMRDFARKAAPCVTSVILAEAIEEVQQFLAHQLRISGIDFSVEMDPSLPPALADQTQIQQVLLNLILNAVEAMKSTPIEPRRVDIRVKVGDGLLEVAVSDLGTGIAPDQLESIFEPFHSTKPEGLGLGLSICRSIIHWHGGRIWAVRNAECGTTITFTLPIAKENHRHATESHHLYRGRRARST